MDEIKHVTSDLDFAPLHRRMQWYVDQGSLPGLSTLTLRGPEVVDFRCYGAMDLAAGHPLAADTIFRIHSNTKLITSIAAMMLVEEGKFRLDDPVAMYLPELADLSVLKPDAKQPEDLEPLRSQITIRQLMTHTAGLSYGFLDSTSVVDRMYVGAGVFQNVFMRKGTLEGLVDMLSRLPLAFQPGSAWRYSLGTDVIARLIEVVTGQQFQRFLTQRIFQPLEMHDTGFYIPEDKRHRFSTLYISREGKHVAVSTPTSSVYYDPNSLQSGGGGLASTIGDFASVIRMLVAGGTWNGVRFLQPETIAMMRASRLPPEMAIGSAAWQMPNTTFGLGFAVKLGPAEGEPASAAGEYHWGGMAGTHWWVAPNANLAGLCMVQVLENFWRPFSHDFKRLAYEIAGAR